MRRRPRSENLDLFSSPAVKNLNESRRRDDEKRADRIKAEEEGKFFIPRRQKPQHPTSTEFETNGRVEPKDA